MVRVREESELRVEHGVVIPKQQAAGFQPLCGAKLHQRHQRMLLVCLAENLSRLCELITPPSVLFKHRLPEKYRDGFYVDDAVEDCGLRSDQAGRRMGRTTRSRRTCLILMPMRSSWARSRFPKRGDDFISRPTRILAHARTHARRRGRVGG